MGQRLTLKIFFLMVVMSVITAAPFAFGESLSYSGRLVNSNGSPVVGPVNLKFDLASTADTSVVLCSQQITNVALTNGVFHVKLDLNCGAPTLSQVLGSIASPDSAAIRVTNESASKVYSFQSLHAVPTAQIAHGLSKLNANNNEVLTWTGSKWEPKPVTGATGGTVTDITAGSGLSGGTITSSGTIAIANSGVADTHLAGNIARSKLANGTANYVLVNNGSGVMSEVAQLPLAQGGTGASTAAAARTNLGLGTAAITNIGYAAGNALPADNIPVCLPSFKLQFTGLGPTYWSCEADNDSLDATKLPLAGGTMSGSIAMGNNKITGLADPTVASDAANKAYVDAQIGGSSSWTVSGSNIYNSNSGNVGIGVTNPLAKLSVDGNISSTGHITSNYGYDGTAQIIQLNTHNGNSALAQVATSSATASSKLVSYGPNHTQTFGGLAAKGSGTLLLYGTGPGFVGTTSNTNLHLMANSSSAVTISTSGNVGIGNTGPLEKLDVAGNIASSGNLKLKSDNTNYVELKAPAALASGVVFTLPGTAGSSGQALVTNGAGILSWANVATTASSVGGDLTGTIASAQIAAGAIVDADVSASAGIAQSKISGLTTDLSNKQPLDATLTSLGAYNTNGILVQTAADTFTGRSISGVANRTTVTNGDGVAGNPVVNVDTNLLPSPAVGDVGKFLKASGANASAWTALASGDITTALGFTPVNKAGDSMASGTFIFSGSSLLQNANVPTNLTDVANKQYVDTAVASAANQWTASGASIYRSSGNVGIGTTNPTERLQVSGDILAQRRLNFQDNARFTVTSAEVSSLSADFSMPQYGVAAPNTGVAADLWLAGYNGIRFFTNGAPEPRVNITTAGNVGVGVITPSDKLHVQISETGSVRLSDSNATGSLISMGEGGSTANTFNPLFRGRPVGVGRFTGLYSEINSSEDTGSVAAMVFNSTILGGGALTTRPIFEWRNDSTPKMTMLANGYLGVGTANPSRPLHVAQPAAAGGNTAPLMIERVNTSGTPTVDELMMIQFRMPNSAGTGIVGADIGTTLTDVTPGAEKGAIVFRTSANGGSTLPEKMRITSGGSVGIGTTLPQRLLQVGDSTHPSALISIFGVDDSQRGVDIGTDFNNRWLIYKEKSSISRALHFHEDHTGVGGGSGNRMTILPGGNVGIGTSNPRQTLEISKGHFFHTGGDLVHYFNAYHNGTHRYGGYAGATSYAGGIGFTPSSGMLYFSTTSTTGAADAAVTTSVNHMNIDRNGNVGIGTSAPGYKLHVNGSVAGVGAYNALSDKRYKKDFQKIPDALDRVVQLNGLYYKWRQDEHPDMQFEKGQDMGVIAQEVKKVFPEAVSTDKKSGFMSVAYSKLIAPIIEAIKELNSNDKKLKREIASLKEQNEMLMKQNEIFEKRLNALEKKDAKKKGP